MISKIFFLPEFILFFYNSICHASNIATTAMYVESLDKSIIGPDQTS